MKYGLWMRWMCRYAAAVLLVIAVSGCDEDDASDDRPGNVYVCMGDSVTADANYPGVAPYPSALAGMVQGTVVNEGRGGETSLGGAGRVRGVLEKHRPTHLLILYGANDVLFSRSPDFIIENLRIMIRAAKDSGAVPLIATLTPMSGDHAIFQGSVEALNARIRALADEEGARLVNLAGEFRGSESERFPDGLHPDADGVVIIAMAFKEKI